MFTRLESYSFKKRKEGDFKNMKYAYLIGRFAVCRILLVLLTLLTCLILPGYCQNNPENHSMQTMQGTVTSLDWVGSMMVVGGTAFSVPTDVNIYKGNEQIDLIEINENEQVTVTYYDDPPGVHNAATIVVQYTGDWDI